jgi:tripartite-type tricarboxylate transporter receptor subunit TctC
MWSMTHGITRQESSFDRTAVSWAGARGLMQLMPGTAREQAGKMGLAYDYARLTTDPNYNVSLGSAYYARLPYDAIKDFTPVVQLTGTSFVLVANPKVPAGSLQELIAMAKAQPGKLNYASSGPGTPYHMAGELFKAMAGLDIVHVPYKESSGARTGVLGGQVEMMFDAVTVMNEHVKAGKVRALATSGKARSSVMPDVPTLAEAGVPGYEAVIWLGLIAPKNTPPAIVNRLNAEITKIVARPDVQAEWAKQGASAMSMTPAAFERYLADDIVKWERIVKVSGARVDR